MFTAFTDATQNITVSGSIVRITVTAVDQHTLSENIIVTTKPTETVTETDTVFSTKTIETPSGFVPIWDSFGQNTYERSFRLPHDLLANTSDIADGTVQAHDSSPD